jgi:hypothetical protein
VIIHWRTEPTGERVPWKEGQDQEGHRVTGYTRPHADCPGADVCPEPYFDVTTEDAAREHRVDLRAMRALPEP